MIHASNSLVRWREILERSAGTFQCRAELRVSFFKVRSALYRDTQRSYFERTRRWTGLSHEVGKICFGTSSRSHGDSMAPADLRQAHEKVVQRPLQYGNVTEGSTTH
jgi:hypothetical protein